MTAGPARPALVLSGGGAYGAYEVGVIKALAAGKSPATEYVPLVPDIVAGTSIGAFNAAMVLSTLDEDFREAAGALEKVWVRQIAGGPRGCGGGVFRYRGNVFNAFIPWCIAQNPMAGFSALAEDAAFFAEDWSRRATNFVQSSADLEQRAVELIDIGTLISVDSFLQLIRDVIVPSTIRASGTRLKIAATNWRTGDLRIFSNEDMTDEGGSLIVAAAAAMPAIFNSTEIEGEPYVDAAVVMNTPLKPAIDAGADILHVIYMDPDVQSIPLPRLRNTLNAIYRLMVIGFGAVMSQDIAMASHINQTLDASTNKDQAEVASRLAEANRRVRPYRKLTIHRYHPREELGGAFKWLSFDVDHLSDLIARGFADAVEHDCVENRCIMADSAAEATLALSVRAGAG